MSDDVVICLSYAHDDDLVLSPDPGELGFDSFLDQQLRLKLRDLGARQANVWRDRRRISQGDQCPGDLALYRASAAGIERDALGAITAHHPEGWRTDGAVPLRKVIEQRLVPLRIETSPGDMRRGFAHPCRRIADRRQDVVVLVVPHAQEFDHLGLGTEQARKLG